MTVALNFHLKRDIFDWQRNPLSRGKYHSFFSLNCLNLTISSMVSEAEMCKLHNKETTIKNKFYIKYVILNKQSFKEVLLWIGHATRLIKISVSIRFFLTRPYKHYLKKKIVQLKRIYYKYEFLKNNCTFWTIAEL